MSSIREKLVKDGGETKDWEAGGLRKLLQGWGGSWLEAQKDYHLCLVGQWPWELMYLPLLQIQNSIVMSSSLEDWAVNQQRPPLVPQAEIEAQESRRGADDLHYCLRSNLECMELELQPSGFADPCSRIKQTQPSIPAAAGRPQASPTESESPPPDHMVETNRTHVSYRQAVCHWEDIPN